MNYLLDLLLCSTVVLIKLSLAILLGLAVQGIVYQLSKKRINLYKLIWKSLNSLDKKLSKIF